MEDKAAFDRVGNSSEITEELRRESTRRSSLFAKIQKSIVFISRIGYNKHVKLSKNLQGACDDMLLEFRASNFKNFKEEFVLDLRPKNIKDLNYSVLAQKIRNKTHRSLCSSVIYGPNAAGKTNIISAIEVFQNIVLNGHIDNNEKGIHHPNVCVDKLELIPTYDNTTAVPVNFFITFIEESILFTYEISINLGKFGQQNAARNIVFEQLSVNNHVIYTRNEDNKQLEINVSSIKNTYLVGGYKEDNVQIARNSLEKNELFLFGGFKSMYSPLLAKIMKQWFSDKLEIFYRSDIMRVVPVVANEHKLTTDSFISDAFGLLSNGINDVGYNNNEEDENARLVSIIELENNIMIAEAEAFESLGTVRFLNLLPLIFGALQFGYTLIMDEFDSSIHPMVVMSIISLFHNDEINKNHAQLIFNTHNPIFLNKTLFRRDEIKFVEYDEDRKTSTLYSLSDFGTSGENGVRSTTDYMKNYFINRYGAIKHIDLSDLYMKWIEDLNVSSEQKED